MTTHAICDACECVSHCSKNGCIPLTPIFRAPSVGCSGETTLHPATADLVRRFSEALAAKLAAAEKKYGYSDGWRSPDWMDECRAKLLEHVAKGDPRDVAAYCAFLWHRGEKTFVPTKADPYEDLMIEVMACGGKVTPREIAFDHVTFDIFMQRHAGKTALDHFADEVEASGEPSLVREVAEKTGAAAQVRQQFARHKKVVGGKS